MISSSLIVLFEDPFWIGIYEQHFGNTFEICKITFGSEPKDIEVYYYILQNYQTLRFKKSTLDADTPKQNISFKRKQRQIKQLVQVKSISTKSQELLKLQYLESKQQRKLCSKTYKQNLAKEKYLLRQEKRKEKHRGH